MRHLVPVICLLALLRSTPLGAEEPAADAAGAEAPKLAEVIFGFAAQDGTPLEAKLRTPAGEEGPFPVVFYLHGAGARTYDSPFPYRDAEGVVRIGRYLDYFAEELARRGVAFCSMSKRGCHPIDASPGMRVEREVFVKATMTVLLEDYALGLKAMRDRTEIDPKRIVLVGSSEGTRLAPQLALRSPEGIIGVAMMGYAADGAKRTVEWQNSIGPWRNIQHLIPAARDGALTTAEHEEAAKEDARVRALPVAQLDADKDGTLTPEDMSAIVRPRLDAILKAVEEHDDDFLWKHLTRLSSAYLLDWWEVEPTQAILLRLDLPLAIYHGDLDGTCRVEGVHETDAAFQKAGKSNLTVHTYADGDHDLNWTMESSRAGGPPAYRDAFDRIQTWTR